MIMCRRMNDGAGVELTERVCQLPFETLIEGLTALWVRQVKCVEYCLGDYIVEVLEELIFGLLVFFLLIFGVFHKHETDEICRHSVKQEFLVGAELFLWIAYDTDYIPETIRDDGVGVLLFQ